MQRFDAFYTQCPYISDVSELRDMTAAAEKALSVVRRAFGYCSVLRVHVLGGYDEWEDGCVSFTTRDYPFWDDARCMSWDELLAEDYASERVRMLREGDGDCYYLTVGGAILTVLTADEPLILYFTGDGGLKPLLEAERKSSQAFLDALERHSPKGTGSPGAGRRTSI